MPIDIQNGIVNESWTVDYDNEKICLQVQAPKLPHCVSVANRNGFADRHPWEIFFRFFNELVWFHDITIAEINGGHSDYYANANFLPSNDNYAISLRNFRQQVFDAPQHLALGFFREGISSGSPFYRFLCYAKIIEIPFNDDAEEAKQWVIQEIPKLKGALAKHLRDKKIKDLGSKPLGKWLKEDGRHGIAHGALTGLAVRDPNSPQDWDDIKWGNEVMHELAEKAITEKLNVPERPNN